MSSTRQQIIYILVLLLSCNVAFTDESTSTITLNSGKEITGRIVESNDEFIKVDTGIGVPITYYQDDIKKYENDVSSNSKKISEGLDNWSSDEKAYYDTGELMLEGNAENGYYRFYFKNGKLKTEGNNKDSLPFDGRQRMWDEEGNLIWEKTYDKGKLLDDDGHPFNGIDTIGMPNGTREEMPYVNGLQHGTSKIYRDGKFIGSTQFKNGKMHGTSFMVDENEGVKIMIDWENGEMIPGSGRKEKIQN